ncbi:Uncharacterised protein [Bacteroides thetaiotaomicron]|uniref:Uncharacterized protein n=1 Tax=Bacteroides thetaiotaomicron TaxID=818 RepID=A0A174NZS7_BACT4|nr:Uncharacterised protein [Bacteroides thetaiotaomicron]
MIVVFGQKYDLFFNCTNFNFTNFALKFNKIRY